MSNSYMGPKDPNDFRRPVRNYSPEDQWQSIQDERQKALDELRKQQLDEQAKRLAQAMKDEQAAKDDKFEIGGAL